MNPPVFVLNALFAETLEDPLGGDLRFRAWRLQELGAGLSILRLKRGRGEGRGAGGAGGRGRTVVRVQLFSITLTRHILASYFSIG
jgi:hypothetical protein